MTRLLVITSNETLQDELQAYYTERLQKNVETLTKTPHPREPG